MTATPEPTLSEQVAAELAHFDADTLDEAAGFHARPCYDPDCQHFDLMRVSAALGRMLRLRWALAELVLAVVSGADPAQHLTEARAILEETEGL